MKRSKWALLLAALLCIVQAVMPMTVFAFTAQTPTRVPEIGEAVTVYTKADMVLDFSSYTFSVMDSSGTEQSGGIHGLTNVMKIWVATTDQQQFTAYCLDMSRHYPATISNTGEQSLYVKDSDMLLGLFVQTLKAGDTAANGSDPNTSACFGDLMAVHGDITSFRFLSTTVVDQTMLDTFNNDERVQFEINGATFADGYELTRDDGHWIYGFWRKSVVQTYNFVTTAWPSGAVYDKMLWVIEHSYPAISMSTMMHDAGADYDRLYTEIAASQGGLSSAELDELVETIVYATIQEAVWHHQPAKVNDDPERFIGAKLIQGHQDIKLLYEYLTRAGRIYQLPQQGFRRQHFDRAPRRLDACSERCGLHLRPIQRFLRYAFRRNNRAEHRCGRCECERDRFSRDGAQRCACRSGILCAHGCATFRCSHAQSQDYGCPNFDPERPRPDVCPCRRSAGGGAATRRYRRHAQPGLGR